MNCHEDDITREVYFLICKFLSRGPCKKAAELLEQEVENYKLLPKRILWDGNQSDISLSQFSINYPHITPDYLSKICSRIGPLLDQKIPPSVRGVISLLGAGTQSLLRTHSGN